MPELPEVQTVVDTLAPHVVGRRIAGFELLRQDFGEPAGVRWGQATAGRVIQGVRRRAKRIVFDLGDHRFFAHLGMTGRITHGSGDRALQRHTHAILSLEDGTAVHFIDPRRFGGLVWLGENSGEASLGPEPLSLHPAGLSERLTRTRRRVKTALLDQRVIAGLGNIYVDESLWLAGIHPLVRGEEVSPDQVRRLNRAIKSTLRRAIRHRGSTLRDYVDADGNRGGFQRLHRVYDRANLPCGRCSALIVRIVVGGRSTHFCPVCQPAPQE